MQIIIHRGSHQIGGMATEIKTDKTRIIIDMGEELSLEDGFKSDPLDIPGVTDNNGICDAILLTHYHGDHTKQLNLARSSIPMYAGKLTKEIMLISEKNQLQRDKKYDSVEKQQETEQRIERIEKIQAFTQGNTLKIGDIQITPYTVDHSAIDAYMFLIEADGKRILYTGDFRLHGFRGKGLPKILRKYIHHCDVLMTEGTALNRYENELLEERELQDILKQKYIPNYKYIFILASTTNMDRIFSAANATPRGKYFICDEYQSSLINEVQIYYSKYSSFYKHIKMTKFGTNLLKRFRKRGFVMMIRQNEQFEEIIKLFDPKQSIILYSMWDGYLIKKDSKTPDFLNLVDNWMQWHTSGHASKKDIKKVIELANPSVVIPMHTENPELIKTLLPGRKVIILQDKEIYTV